jgi:hypothetical protein
MVKQEVEDNNLHFTLVRSLHNKDLFPYSKQEGNHVDCIHLYCTSQYVSYTATQLHQVLVMHLLYTYKNIFYRMQDKITI